MQTIKKAFRYIDRMFKIAGENRQYVYPHTDLF